GAAVLLRHLNAHQSQRGKRGYDLGREMLRFVPLADMRANLRLRKLANASTKKLLLFGQPEVHPVETVPLCSAFTQVDRRQPGCDRVRSSPPPGEACLRVSKARRVTNDR